MTYQENLSFNRMNMTSSLIHISNFLIEFARKRKPSGLKKERRRGKLPNQVRHDENASIAVGTWTNKGVRSNNDKK